MVTNQSLRYMSQGSKEQPSSPSLLQRYPELTYGEWCKTSYLCITQSLDVGYPWERADSKAKRLLHVKGKS